MRLIRLLKNDLKQEIHEWVNKKMISCEQAESICTLYGMDYHDKQNNYAYSVLVILAYLFIGLAVITLLSANWDEIPRALRMGGLITLTLSVNLWALYQYRQQQVDSAIGWFFLGSLFYGASIMLIAQIYHLGEHFPDGILWWTIGVLPLAIVLRSTVLLLLATILGFIWFFVEADLGFYPVLFPILLVAIANFLRTSKEYYSLFIALVMGTTLWLEYSFAWWLNDGRGFHFNSEHLVLSTGLFLLYHSIAKYLGQQKNIYWADYGAILSVWVLRFTLLALLILSFDEPWEVLLSFNWQYPFILLAFASIFSLISIVISILAQRQYYSTIVFALVYLILSSFILFVDTDKHHWAVILQIIDNLILISTGIWLIIRGLQDNISHYFFLGILAIMCTALLRYFNFIGDYIGASILFIVFAIILLSAAKYWKLQQNRNEVKI